MAERLFSSLLLIQFSAFSVLLWLGQESAQVRAGRAAQAWRAILPLNPPQKSHIFLPSRFLLLSFSAAGISAEFPQFAERERKLTRFTSSLFFLLAR